MQNKGNSSFNEMNNLSNEFSQISQNFTEEEIKNAPVLTIAVKFFKIIFLIFLINIRK